MHGSIPPQPPTSGMHRLIAHARTSVFIFMMQFGFALLEAGEYRSLNTTTILFKNLIDFALTALGWWLFGFSLYYSTGDYNAGSGADATPNSIGRSFGEFVLLLGFASSAVTIQSGAVGARTKLGLYVGQSFVLGAIAFPLVARWTWREGGWLQKRGFIDFAGGVVVHVLGGAASFVACIVVGPRRCTRNLKKGSKKKANDPSVVSVAGHSLPFSYLGCMILWLGWLFFNAGSTKRVSADGDISALKCLVNSFLAPSAAIISCAVASYVRFGVLNMPMVLNSILGALAAVTSGSAVIEPWGAVLQGAVVGTTFQFISTWMQRHNIDDPVDAITVHGICGSFGALTLPFFIDEEAYLLTYGVSWNKNIGEQLGEQIIGIVTIASFAAAINLAVMVLFWAFQGIRVDAEIEDLGFDLHLFGTHAYPEIKEVIKFQENVMKLKRKVHGSSSRSNSAEQSETGRVQAGIVQRPVKPRNRFRRPKSAYRVVHTPRSKSPVELKPFDEKAEQKKWAINTDAKDANGDASAVSEGKGAKDSGKNAINDADVKVNVKGG